MRRIAVLCLLLLAGCGSGPPSSAVPADASIYLGVNAGEDEGGGYLAARREGGALRVVRRAG